MSQNLRDLIALYSQTSFDFARSGEITWSEENPHLGTGEPDNFLNYLPKYEQKNLIQAEGYAIYYLCKESPGNSSSRLYTISYQPSLWEKYTVSREWGSVGTERPRRHQAHFRSSRTALECIDRLIRRRLKHGYQLTSAA